MSNTTSFQGRLIHQMEYQGRKVSYIADQLIVKLKPEWASNAEARKSIFKVLPKESTLQDEFDAMGMAVVNLPASSDLFEVARELNKQVAVEFAEPNFLESA